jgi:hypothetical protein
MECQSIYHNPGDSNPQYVKCSIDHSWFNISQYAVITIYPTLDENGNLIEGPTTIDVMRVWGD